MCDSSTRPAFIPAPDCARVRVVQKLFDQTVMNVFYFKGDAPLIASDLSSLVSEVHTAWVARFKPAVPSDLSLQFIEAVALDSATAPGVSALYTDAGTATGTSMPGNVTFAVKFSTGLTGRSNHGRMYWLGINRSDVTGDELNSSNVSGIVGAVNSFFDDIETATGLTHVVVSYCNDGAWRTTAAANPVILAVATDGHLDSQRRRLSGRGI